MPCKDKAYMHKDKASYASPLSCSLTVLPAYMDVYTVLSMYSEKSPIHSEKSPMYAGKSPIYSGKSPIKQNI